MTRDLRIEHTFNLADAIPQLSLEIPATLARALENDLDQLAPLLHLPGAAILQKWPPKTIAGWVLDNTQPGWLIQAAIPRYKPDGTAIWRKPHRRWFYTQSYAKGILRARKWADEINATPKKLATSKAYQRRSKCDTQ